jgi:hypothetical protein
VVPGQNISKDGRPRTILKFLVIKSKPSRWIIVEREDCDNSEGKSLEIVLSRKTWLIMRSP